MGAALIRPLPIRLLPINRPAAAAAGRDFSDSFQFVIPSGTTRIFMTILHK